MAIGTPLPWHPNEACLRYLPSEPSAVLRFGPSSPAIIFFGPAARYSEPLSGVSYHARKVLCNPTTFAGSSLAGLCPQCEPPHRRTAHDSSGHVAIHRLDCSSPLGLLFTNLRFDLLGWRAFLALDGPAAARSPVATPVRGLPTYLSPRLGGRKRTHLGPQLHRPLVEMRKRLESIPRL